MCRPHLVIARLGPPPPGGLVMAEQYDNFLNFMKESVTAVLVPSCFVITTCEFTFHTLPKDDMK